VGEGWRERRREAAREGGTDRKGGCDKIPKSIGNLKKCKRQARGREDGRVRRRVNKRGFHEDKQSINFTAFSIFSFTNLNGLG